MINLEKQWKKVFDNIETEFTKMCDSTNRRCHRETAVVISC